MHMGHVVIHVITTLVILLMRLIYYKQKKSTEMLCNFSSSLLQWIMENLFIDEVEISGKRNMDLQKDA